MLLKIGGAIPTTVSGKLYVVSGSGLVVGSKGKEISLEDLPQDKIKELIKTLSEVRRKKYKRCSEN